MGEARHRLGACQVRPAHEAAQAAVTGRVTRQQHEVRAALPFPDAAQILLHRLAMAGEYRALGTRPRRQPVGGERRDRRQAAARPLVATRRRGATPRRAPPSPRRQCDSRKIGRRRIRQFDLHADHRPQPRVVRRGRKPHHAVEAVVVRDRQPGKPEFHGAGNQLVRGRGSVEEREVRVAVELGVFGHSWPRSTVSAGLHSIEHAF